MAVRLGTQDWINPGPFQAAAEMVVDAGRATGAGIAALGAGIGQGLQNRQARQERQQARQDMLDQRGIENARADRAEARMLKQSKLAASESILAAKKMNLDMASKMYEAMGTPEAEAAMLKAQQDFQEANNWYQVSVGNNAEIEPPRAGVTDYLGVGGGDGVRVGGKSMSQMTDAELDGLMEKSARGEVDYTYRGGATGDMGQGVGNVTLSSQQPSMEAAAELVSAMDFARAATKKRQQAVDVLATGKTRDNRAKADKLKLDAEFLEFEAQRRGQQETAKASAENTRANQAAEDARADAREKAAVAEWNAAHPDRPITSTKEIGPQYADQRQDKAQDFKREQAAERTKVKNDQMQMMRRWRVEDRDIQMGRLSAKDAAARAQFDVAEAGRRVGRAETHMNNLQDAFRMNKATKEELTEAANDFSDAMEMYQDAQDRLKSLGTAAPAPVPVVPTPTSQGTADLVDDVFK